MLDKKELSSGSQVIKVHRNLPRKNQTRPARSAPNAAKKSEEATRAYMKIENLPEGLSSKDVKTLYAKYGVESVDVNQTARHCIIRVAKPEDVALILKDKISAPNGTLLVAKPYFPKTSGKKAPAESSRGNASKVRTEKKTFRCLIDDADPAKCTKEQLEATFKGFTGFVSLTQMKTDASKYTATYDNEEAVNDILKSKEITCGTAKLTVRPPVSRGAPAPREPKGAPAPREPKRAPREPRRTAPRAIIRKPLTEVTSDQVLPLIQAFDKQAIVKIGFSGDILISFSSSEARDAALGKDVKVGTQVLKLEQAEGQRKRNETRDSRTPRRDATGLAEFGVFLPGVTQSQATVLPEQLKAVCEVVRVHTGRTGTIVSLKSQKDEEALLATTVNVEGSGPVKPEVLRNKRTNLCEPMSIF